MVRAKVKIGAPQKKILDQKFFFQTLGQKLRPRSFKWRPLFALFQGGGGANGGILVKFAPLLLRHYGPRPRWPPPCYGPAYFTYFISRNKNIQKSFCLIYFNQT